MTEILNEQNTKTNFRFFAFNIIKSEGKKLSATNKALTCLAKSDLFFKELTNIYSGLHTNNITPTIFDKIISSINIPQTDKERLVVLADLYKNYLEIMADNNFQIPPYNINLPIKNYKNIHNPDIQEIINFLYKTFLEKEPITFEDTISSNIEYLEFSDIQNEIQYIIDEIKSLTQNNLAKYNEIAIFVDKTEARTKFIEIIKSQNLPVISSLYNEHYENLKYKISIYQKISELFITLNFTELSYDEIKNPNIKSKAEKEICYEKLDEIFKQILTEILTNPYAYDKIFTNAQLSNKSLLELIFIHWNEITPKDKNEISNEFNAINAFYQEYKNQNYANAIKILIKKIFVQIDNNQLKEAVAGKIKSLDELQNLYTKLQTKPEFDSFKEIMQGLPKDTEKSQNSIYLSAIDSNLQNLKEFKYIYITCLTQNNYPAPNTSYPFISEKTNNIIIQELTKINPNYKYFLKTDDLHFQQKLHAMCSVMSLASKKLTLTTHAYEAKKQTISSIFFQTLSYANKSNYKIVEDLLKKDTLTSTNIDIEIANNTKEYIIDKNEILKLNASSISTFQKCPRKYYYKHLLNLKEPYSFSASYGSIVHAIFQVLNTNYKDNYSKTTALALAEILFNINTDEAKATQVGFTQIDIELIKATPQLLLDEMKINFIDAIEDFNLSGGFDIPPIKAECEKAFSFKLEEIPNVIFDGRIDAIITNTNKEIRIIDYKTGKNKTNSLDYAISDNGVNFLLKTGKEPSNKETLQNAYDYQIPLYYLASQNCPEFAEYKNTLTELGLIYIRPKSKDNGYNEDFVNKTRLDEYKDKIIKNLKETIVEKIQNTKEFNKSKSWDCEFCSYNFLCNKEDSDD